MSIVITLLLLIAASVVPNLVAIKHSRDLQDIEASLARLPIEAKNEARKSNEPVSLRIDGTTMIEERHPQTDNTNNTNNNADADAQEVKRVDFGAAFQVDSVTQGTDTTDVASWKWTAYPDGSADAGGVTFTQGTTRRTMVLKANGDTQWTTGDMPQDANDTWTAGELEQRVQSQ